MLTKVCTTCEVEKSVDEYHKQKLGKYGVAAVCGCCANQRTAQYDQDNKEAKVAYRKANKKAIAEKDKVYYQANKEAIAEQMKAYYQANKEAIAKQVSAYRQANKKTIAERDKAYYQANKESIAAYRQANKESIAAYRQANAHLINAYAAKRRATKLQATPAWTDLDAIKGMYQLATIFNRTGINLQVDHIVPLQGKTVCGLHSEANLQLMSATENISKGNRQWPDMP